MSNPLQEVGEEELAATVGGLRWEGHEQSANIEDRRTGGWTESLSIETPGDFARWDRTFGPEVGGPSGGASGRDCDFFCTLLAY